VGIVAPHTSNWDFTLGLAVVFVVNLRVSWLGKHTLFKAPFRGFLRWMGGIPVDRGASHGVVGECAAAFDTANALLLALAPEGTRKGASHWKSGFYQIAVKARVPIFPIGFDYGEHVIRLMPLFTPSGDYDTDIGLIQELFASVKGKRERPAK
jgi:1-acyl-sn-glycerol-3-phosphate acyltransferase